MIQIGDVVVSLDVFQEKFLCDLGACKGACCIEGDAGAPVELDEVMASCALLKVAASSGRIPRSLASASSMARLVCSFGSAARTEVSKGRRC